MLEETLDKYAVEDVLISVAPAKGQQRMQVCGLPIFPLFMRKRVDSLAQAKRIEYLEESEEPSISYAAQICDVVRAMILCGRVEDLLDAYHAVMRAFNVVQGRGRVKMNFSEENTSKPPDV